MAAVFSRSRKRQPPEPAPIPGEPRPAGSRRQLVRRERQPVKHCKQAHQAPNAGAPAATGVRSTRGGAKYVYIIAHYVTRLKERSGGRTESTGASTSPDR